MPVSKLLWGTGLENEVRLGFPFFDLVTDREEEEGNQHLVTPGGTPISWIPGRYYTIDAEARWIPDGPGTAPVQTALSGAVGWQEFLDWARDAGLFRFVPDENVPDFYVDNVQLMEPRKGFGSLSPDIKRNVRLKLRNPTMDFHQALRGIMFEYAPGASLTDPVAWTQSRASVGGLLNSLGRFESLAVNALRDRHYPLGYSGVLPAALPLKTTLLERGVTNKLTTPEGPYSGGDWGLSGTTVPSTNNPDPKGGATANFVREDTSTGVHGLFQSYTIGATSKRGALVFLKTVGSRTKGRLRITNPTGVEASVVFDLVAGTLSAPADIAQLIPLADGYFCIWVYGGAGAGNTAAQFGVVFRDAAGAESYTGDGASGFYIWGCVATDNEIPGMYWGTGASKSPDILYRPFTYRVQPMWWLVDYIETGTLFSGTTAGDTPRLLNISGDDSAPRAGLYHIGNVANHLGAYYGNVNGFSESAVNVLHALGDRIQLLGYIDANGAPKLVKRVNLGSESAGSLGTARGFPTRTWGSQTLTLGGLISGTGATTGYMGLIRAAVGPFVFNGVTRDTIAKALVA